MGTDERMMNWIKDTYSSFYGEEDINADACVTGKSISQNGIAGHKQGSGLGIYYGMRELLNNKDFIAKTGLTKGVEGKTLVIQGYGNEGYYTAEAFQKAGAKIVGISELRSGIYNEEVIDVDEAHKYFQKNGALEDFPNAEYEEIDDSQAIM